MRILNTTARLFLVLVLLGCAQSVPDPEADLVITGATLIDGTGALVRDGTTIIVDDGRIVLVAPDGEAGMPSGVRMIDAVGKYVLPGFTDMHVHFGSGGLEPAEATTTDRILSQFLFYGVTSVFGVGGTGGNVKSIQAMRSRAASGEVIAPHLYVTGSMLTLPGSHPVATIMRVPDGADPEAYDWLTRGVAVVATIEEARAAVRSNARAGMDGIKIVVESGPTPFGDDHPQMPPEMIAAIVQEASLAGLPVVAHVSSLDELEDAVAGGVHAIMHAAGGPWPGPEHWSEMRERNVYYVPTLTLYAPGITDRWTRPGAIDDSFLRAGVAAHTLESLKSWESPMASVPEAVRTDLWKELLESIRVAYEAGVPIALGTDTNNPFVFPGHSAHVELELLVEAGKRADLLILAADPLADIRNTQTLELVIRRGKIVERPSALPNH